MHVLCAYGHVRTFYCFDHRRQIDCGRTNHNFVSGSDLSLKGEKCEGSSAPPWASYTSSNWRQSGAYAWVRFSMVIAFLVFLDQIVEHGKGLFSIHPAGQSHHCPTAEKAENQVAKVSESQHERHRLARQPVPQHAGCVERGNKSIRPPNGKAISPRLTRYRYREGTA